MKKQTSIKWLTELYPNSIVLDPDGWDRKNYQYSFYEEQITKEEFERRFMMSTVGMKPIVATSK